MAFALSQTVVSPALPEIQREFGADAVVGRVDPHRLPARGVGRDADRRQARRPLRPRPGADRGAARRSPSAARSARSRRRSACSCAGRIIQGVGGGIFPLAFGIIRETFPPERVATAIGGISATFGIGGGVGLVIAGLIVEALDASWLFWLGPDGAAGRVRDLALRPAGGDAARTRRSTGSAPRCSASRSRACSTGSARPTPGAGARRACSASIVRRPRPGRVLGAGWRRRSTSRWWTCACCAAGRC